MPFVLDPMIASADRSDLAKADRCRQFNDSFRLTLLGGKVVLSHGVAGLPVEAKAEVLLVVRGFNNFSPENDPYEEHDFGAVECRGKRYFWKIDYRSWTKVDCGIGF